MKEILFKALTKEGKWVEGGYVTGAGKTQLLHLEEVFNEELAYHGSTNCKSIKPYGYDVISETVCQYTNLKDKNGNLIFEGDIVKDLYPETQWEGIGPVIYLNGSYGIRYNKPIQEDFLGMNLDCLINENGICEIEVIGNIHDKEESNDK